MKLTSRSGERIARPLAETPRDVVEEASESLPFGLGLETPGRHSGAGSVSVGSNSSAWPAAMT